MESDFELILEECLAQLRGGKSIEDCLAAHPSDAIKLRPLLETAAQVQNISIPRARAEAVAAGRERLLAGFKLQNSTNLPVSSEHLSRYTKHGRGTLPNSRSGAKHSSLGFAYRVATILVFVFIVAGGLTINVSAGSLPGDKLYGVKRTWESLRLSLTPNDEIRQKLQERFAAERLDEIDELILHRRAELVEFAAPLEAMDAESWKVDGFQIKVAPTTYIVGIPKLGEMVYVRARLLADGTLTALQVRVPGQTLPTPFATITPLPNLTPKVLKDHPTETPEPSLDPQEPSETDEPTVRPTRDPENEASPTLIQNTQTPDSTEKQEPEEGGTQEPTEAPHLTHTPEATEQPHETLEATARSRGTSEATEQEPHTPEATDGD